MDTWIEKYNYIIEYIRIYGKLPSDENINNQKTNKASR